MLDTEGDGAGDGSVGCGVGVGVGGFVGGRVMGGFGGSGLGLLKKIVYYLFFVKFEKELYYYLSQKLGF